MSISPVFDELIEAGWVPPEEAKVMRSFIEEARMIINGLPVSIADPRRVAWLKDYEEAHKHHG